MNFMQQSKSKQQEEAQVKCFFIVTLEGLGRARTNVVAVCTLHTLDHLVLSLSELSVLPDVGKAPNLVQLNWQNFTLYW